MDPITAAILGGGASLIGSGLDYNARRNKPNSKKRTVKIPLA